MTLPANEDLESLQTKQIVALTMEGMPEYKIAEQLKMSRYAVKKIRNSEKFKSLLKEIGDSAVAAARDRFKARLDDMAPLAIEALEHNLKEKKIEGVRLFAEITGLKEKDSDDKGAGTLQVFLPGASPNTETVIDITPKDEK